MKEKLYCYVDETGQDTKGKLFIVVAIVVEKEREMLIERLEKVEKQTKKWKNKWFKTRRKIKLEYIKLALSLGDLKKKVYYQVFRHQTAYHDLTCLVIAKALHRYLESRKIKKYKATILIDGLRKNQENQTSKILRDLGIGIRKVRGVRDDANAIVRLTDALAGMIRETDKGNTEFLNLKKKLSDLG